jgi:hypothetical protein
VLLVITSCEVEKDGYKGFWYGVYTLDGIQSPVLGEMTDSSFFEYTGLTHRLFPYERRGNTFILPNVKTTDYTYDIKVKYTGDELIFYRNRLFNDTVFLTMRRAVKDNFIIERLKDDNLRLDFADIEMDGYRNFYYPSVRDIIYIGKKDGMVMCSYKDSVMPLNDDFYYYVNSTIDSMILTEAFHLAVDKNIRYSDVNKVLEYLSLTSKSSWFGVRVNFLVKPHSYVDYTYVERYFSIYEERKEYYKNRGLIFNKSGRPVPPPPPPIMLEWFMDKERSTINMFLLKDGELFFDGKRCELNEVKSLMSENIDSVRHNMFVYYIHPDSKYEYYLKLFNELIECNRIIKKEYAAKISGKDIEDIYTRSEEMHRARRVLQIGLSELDSLKYIRYKKLFCRTDS